jgi:glycosyltransferase involved in cell wall biosynthesis
MTTTVTMVASRFRDGGVERLMNRLAAGLLAEGVGCRFVLGETGAGAAAAAIPEGVMVERAEPRSVARHLVDVVSQTAGQQAVLIFRSTDCSPVIRNLAALGASRPRVFIVAGDYLSPRLQRTGMARIKAWKYRRRIRADWQRVDGIITTHPAITDDWLQTGLLMASQLHTLHPPVVGPDIDALSQESVPHPWLNEQTPVVLGVGRLTTNKRFELLLRAVALTARQRRIRLIILGRGPEESGLRRLADELGIADSVAFPGYAVNPYSWMRYADVLALPSRVEPLGLVLIEALYVGTPFVATRTPPGPASIMATTGQGQILAEDTPECLADALDKACQTTPPIEAMRSAAEAYDYRRSSREYMAVLLASSTS